MSSISRWRSGLIAAVRRDPSIGRLLLVEGSRNAPSAPRTAQSRCIIRALLVHQHPAPLPRSGVVHRPTLVIPLCAWLLVKTSGTDFPKWSFMGAVAADH